MSLDDAVGQLEESAFEAALGNVTKAKQTALSSIKIVNNYAKSTPNNDSQVVVAISKYLLSWYESIDKMLLSEKLLQMGSRANGGYFPPVINFSLAYDSTAFIPSHRPKAFNQPDSHMIIPHDVAYHFQEQISVQGSISDLHNLTQDLLTNCLFVCALLAVIHCKPDLLLSCCWGTPPPCRVKLHFNGSERLVPITSEVPILKNGRSIVIRSSSNDNLWWPAFLEKAYLKVMGQGYEFKGSNFAIDCYMLLGWLPQVQLITGRLLKDILEAFSRGDALVGLGMGPLSKELSSKLNLVPNHDYVVIDVREKDGEHEFCVKNPWLVQERLQWYRDSELYKFAYLYVCWRPTFDFQVSTTFIAKNLLDIHQWLQFKLEYPEGSERVWIMLERHYPVVLSDKSNEEIIIKVKVFDTAQGEKVLTLLQYNNVYKSKGTNNRIELIKLQNLNPGSYTIAIYVSRQCNVTMTAFSDKQLQISKAKYIYPEILSLEDAWYPDTNGGNYALGSFIENPQFSLELDRDMEVQVALFGELQEHYYNIHIYPFTQVLCNISPPICDVNYKKGCAVYPVKLSKGKYRLFCLTYDRLELGMPAKFKLMVNSATKGAQLCRLSSQLGTFEVQHQFEWANNKKYKYHFRSLTANCLASFRITYSGPKGQGSSYRPMMRASVFYERTELPLQVNENWDDPVYGVFLQVQMPVAEDYILLVERLEPGEGTGMIRIGLSSRLG